MVDWMDTDQTGTYNQSFIIYPSSTPQNNIPGWSKNLCLEGTSKYDVITFRDIFTPHPPFPTASSFGTLVGGAHLMMSYLNKHFEPVPILCAVDFCLESRPVNPIVYLVKKKWEWNTKILIIFVLSIQNVQYVTVRIPSCRWFESVMMFL